MSDPYHEHEDRLLIEEHAAHPERFHRVVARPEPETKTERQRRAGKAMYRGGYIAMLEHQRDQLQRWKDEQMFVESVWNPQEVGTLLGMTLGTDIRANIASKVSELIEERDRLAEALTELRNAKWLSLPGRAGDIIESALTAIKQ